MSLLDWFFVGLLSFALLCLLLFGFFLFYYFSLRTELKKNWQRRPKKKIKRKKWTREKSIIEHRKKKYGRNTILFFLLVLFSASGAFYARYYQLTNLTTEDSKIVVQGYLLAEDIEKKLETVSEGGSAEKIFPQLQEVSSMLVSYSNHQISKGLSQEGARLLTQYSAAMKDIGINLTKLQQTDLDNKELISSYLEDLKKLKERQKKVFTYFGVNESALKEKN